MSDSTTQPAKEIMVYLIDGPSADDNDTPIRQWKDEDFIAEAEKQGLVYTLQEFQAAFNDDSISDQWYIRITGI